MEATEVKHKKHLHWMDANQILIDGGHIVFWTDTRKYHVFKNGEESNFGKYITEKTASNLINLGCMVRVRSSNNKRTIYKRQPEEVK